MALSRYNPYRNAVIEQSPFEELLNVRGELNRLFGNWGGNSHGLGQLLGNWAPALDLEETEDAVKVEIELPGLKKEDIKVSVENDVLTISGERKQTVEVKETGRSERYFGKFSRTVTLPASVDASAAKASYKDGILSVAIPKAEHAKPKSISIGD